MMGVLLSACWLMAGCSVIDDDLSDCKDDGKQYKMDYQLKLVTNMTTELKTELTTITEISVANALETHLKNIFTDFAHDVDLSFYDTEGEQKRLEHVQDIINANQSSYTLTLPMRRYQHLAVANIKDNNVIDLNFDEDSKSSRLVQTSGEKVASHTTGLFTARQPMEVLENIDQTFNVHLYMANSAATLVINPKGLVYTDMKVYATGFANAFLINDSTYLYSDKPPLIETQKVTTDNDLLCFCSVNFPSRDEAVSSLARRAGESSTPSLWQFKIYLTLPDGKVTETTLDIPDPLKAGDLKVIKGELDTQGSVRPYNSAVGVSVTLDWNNGGEYNPEL